LKYIIGFCMILLGGVLLAVTGFMPFLIILFIGVFLFASFPSEAILYNYVLANSNQVLLRKRCYIIFLPFYIVSYILTFGKAILQIVWKEEYFIATIHSEGNIEQRQISRKEYIAIRNQQRKIYSTQQLSKAFITSSYSVEEIGFKRKKTRLLLASIFACLMLLMLVEPGGIYLTLIYEAVFIPMILLWIPEYQDAKILQQAYDRAVTAE